MGIAIQVYRSSALVQHDEFGECIAITWLKNREVQVAYVSLAPTWLGGDEISEKVLKLSEDDRNAITADRSPN